MGNWPVHYAGKFKWFHGFFYWRFAKINNHRFLLQNEKIIRREISKIWSFRKSTPLRDGHSLPPSDHLLRFLVESTCEEIPKCANCDRNEKSPMFFCNTCGNWFYVLFCDCIVIGVMGFICQMFASTKEVDDGAWKDWIGKHFMKWVLKLLNSVLSSFYLP